MAFFRKNTAASDRPVLVLGATGKTGRRVASRLRDAGIPFRPGSRGAAPAFDWQDEAGWQACLAGMRAVYLNYAPDLAAPGAQDAIEAFLTKAKRAGIRRIVLLSGRGEEEARACEGLVAASGLDFTIVRASWFNQNFSEGAFTGMVRAGTIALPAGHVPEPFIDVDDIADIVAAALADDGHEGEVYEVTGPRLLTMSDIASILSQTLGRDIFYTDIPNSVFIEETARSGAPKEIVWLLDYLFCTVLDGRNAHLTDGVERALGRRPRDFADYAKNAAAAGAWAAE